MLYKSAKERAGLPRLKAGRLVASLVIVTALTFVGVSGIEVLKHFLNPRLTMWDYHIFSIVSSSIIASAAALFVLVKLERFLDRIVEENDELELRVRERTVELTRINQALEDEIAERRQAEKALREAKARTELYVDLMSHDIGNINHAAMGYLELARDMLDLSEKEKEMITRPAELIKSSSTLIDNVKKLQRIKSEPLREETIDLGPLLSSAISAHTVASGRTITINYSPATGYYVIANDLLRDVFSNLLGNALKHSNGPLVINIGLSTVSLDGAKYHRVVVEDDGPGIPDDLKKNILTDAAETAGHDRRGLGLQLVKTLIEAFKGKVRVEDRIPGDYSKGSRFAVMLPAVKSPELPIG
jgi:signal transduction histidine kinase